MPTNSYLDHQFTSFQAAGKALWWPKACKGGLIRLLLGALVMQDAPTAAAELKEGHLDMD